MKLKMNLKTSQAGKPVNLKMKIANPANSYINEAIKANKAKLKRLLTYKHEIDFILYCEQERILKLLHNEMGNTIDSKWLIDDFRQKIQYKPITEATESILTNETN